MITTDKKCVRDSLNHVLIKDGWIYYTNSFVLFKRGITTHGNIPEIYIHIDEWKKIGKKEVSLISMNGGVATFLDNKNNKIECVAKTELNESFPDVNCIEVGDTTKEIKITLHTLELLIAQMKIEGKHTLEMGFTDKPISRVLGTEHLFTRNT